MTVGCLFGYQCANGLCGAFIFGFWSELGYYVSFGFGGCSGCCCCCCVCVGDDHGWCVTC